MRILLALLTLAVTATTVHAQVPSSGASPRRVFAEGMLVGEYIDTLGPAIERWGGGAEIGTEIWQSQTDVRRTASARIRAWVMEDIKGVSFTVAPEYRWSRVGFELPVGMDLLAGGSTLTGAFTLGMGLPIVVSERIAVVPRATGHLLVEDGIPGLLTTVGLGVRWRL